MESSLFFFPPSSSIKIWPCATGVTSSLEQSIREESLFPLSIFESKSSRERERKNRVSEAQSLEDAVQEFLLLKAFQVERYRKKKKGSKRGRKGGTKKKREKERGKVRKKERGKRERSEDKQRKGFRKRRKKEACLSAALCLSELQSVSAFAEAAQLYQDGIRRKVVVVQHFEPLFGQGSQAS